MEEVHSHCVVFRRCPEELRREHIVVADAVSLEKHQLGQAVGERNLVFRVDVLGQPAVGGGDEAGIRIVDREALLRRLEFGQPERMLLVVAERRELNDVDRHLRVLEPGPPAPGERLEFFGVDRAFVVVVFALVPEQPLDCERHGSRERRRFARARRRGAPLLR